MPVTLCSAASISHRDFASDLSPLLDRKTRSRLYGWIKSSKPVFSAFEQLSEVSFHRTFGLPLRTSHLRLEAHLFHPLSSSMKIKGHQSPTARHMYSLGPGMSNIDPEQRSTRICCMAPSLPG